MEILTSPAEAKKIAVPGVVSYVVYMSDSCIPVTKQESECRFASYLIEDRVFRVCDSSHVLASPSQDNGSDLGAWVRNRKQLKSY